jgi:hypothetical protein
VILALVIGLLILMGTLDVYGPSIVAITLVAAGIAYLINRIWKTDSPAAANRKRWILRGAVSTVAAFAFGTGFLQTLHPDRQPVSWLPAANSTKPPPPPPAPVLEHLLNAPAADRDQLCKSVCANGWRKWDPKYFDKSVLYDFTSEPKSAGLLCYYQEMPTPADYEDSSRDAELDKRCAERGATGCWWAIMYGAQGKRVSCMRPVFHPQPTR